MRRRLHPKLVCMACTVGWLATGRKYTCNLQVRKEMTFSQLVLWEMHEVIQCLCNLKLCMQT